MSYVKVLLQVIWQTLLGAVCLCFLGLILVGTAIFLYYYGKYLVVLMMGVYLTFIAHTTGHWIIERWKSKNKN